MAELCRLKTLNWSVSGHEAGGCGRRPHISSKPLLPHLGMARKDMVFEGRLLALAVAILLEGLSPRRSPFRIAWNGNGSSLIEHPCQRNKKEHHRKDTVNTPLQWRNWVTQSGAWAAAGTLTITLASACGLARQTREGPGCRAVAVASLETKWLLPPD